MRQIAWISTHWTIVEGGFVPALNTQIQQGESIVCARDFVIRGTPLQRHMLVVKAIAEEARINALNGSVHFVIATAWEDESNQSPTSRHWSSPLSAAEVTALNGYLTTKTGLTSVQIANWFNMTPSNLSTWLQNNPRSEAITRLLGAWYEWRN